MKKDTQKKKDILFVVDERRMGGVSVLLEDMMNMIDTNKYNFDILVLHNNGEMFNNLPKNVNLIYGTPYFDAVDYTYKEVFNKKNPILIYRKIKIVLDMKTGNIEKVIKRERKKILKKKYDIEIAFKDGFTALFTIFGDSAKKLHWLHYEYKKTNSNQKYDNLFRKILPLFDKIIAVSKGVEDAFNDLYHLEEKTMVINNIVDTNKIKNKSLEKSDVNLSKKDINIVSVGRLHPMKGFDRAINVINRLKSEDKLPNNFRYRIYGNGPMYNQLKQMVDDYKLNNVITLYGQVSNPFKYIKNSDLFILPSVYEPFGLVIVESMTLGVPVLATENSATSKIIDNKVNGYITENSEEGIYEGLLFLLSNKDELAKYENNLKNYKYENKKIVESIEAFFI